MVMNFNKFILGLFCGIVFITACGAALETNNATGDTSSTLYVYNSNGDKVGRFVSTGQVLLEDGYLASFKVFNDEVNWTNNDDRIYFATNDCSGTAYVPFTTFYQRLFHIQNTTTAYQAVKNSSKSSILTESYIGDSGTCTDTATSNKDNLVQAVLYTGTLPNLTSPLEIK